MSWKTLKRIVKRKDGTQQEVTQYKDDKGRFTKLINYNRWLETSTKPSKKGYLYTLKNIKGKYRKRRIGKKKYQDLNKQIKAIQELKTEKKPPIPKAKKKPAKFDVRTRIKFNFVIFGDQLEYTQDQRHITGAKAVNGTFSIEEMCKKTGFNPLFWDQVQGLPIDAVKGGIEYTNYRINPLYGKAKVFPIQDKTIQKIRYNWDNPNHRRKIATLGGAYD